MSSGAQWEFWIDRGGTFTDCLGCPPDGGPLRVAKVLSSDEAPLRGIREILGLDAAEPIPACRVRLGTTVATNALLERGGVPCALVITRGFGDLLAIGTQARPELFALDIVRPPPLYQEVLEISARAGPDGELLERPDMASLRGALAALRERVDSLAVVLLHAYAAPELEREVAALAAEVGFEHVATSHELAAELGLLARGDTAVADAYLTPLLRSYLATLARALPGSQLQLMQSSGGLTNAEGFRGPAAVLSGPAGGVVACARIAEQAGVQQLIGFDMGGTSTDVCRVAGEPERSYETVTAGVRIRAPMLAVHTVAAGGGSVCRFDGQRFVVGPESAGSDPGPLCYGRDAASELTVTDVNLLLGRVLADRFPFELARGRVQTALAHVAAAAGYARPELAAAGFFEVANHRMAEAIKQISVARGYDVRHHTLLLFGGAAGQHGCAIARLLGIRRVLSHPHAGVLSAYGIGLADAAWHGERDAGRALLDDALLTRLEPLQAELSQRGHAKLVAEGHREQQIRVYRRLDLRYRGTETSITLERDEATALRAAFERSHQRLFGYFRSGHPIEVVTLRVEVRGLTATPADTHLPAQQAAPEPLRLSPLWQQGAFEQVPVYRREQLGPGQSLLGPCVVLEQTGTLVVERGFVLRVDETGLIELRDEQGPAPSPVGIDRDPVQLELFHNQFMSIAEQMGRVLRRTALSTNIRERLDFSCALFDRHGGLVANAPHIPVHLGAMEQTVKALLEQEPAPPVGSAYVSNDPARGGSHLPDITVLTPVHQAGELAYLVASRGHHSDVGGITPGSMPAQSRSLEEEGVVLRGLRLVSDGELDERSLRAALAQGPHPARDPDQNVADIEAQLAANHTGAKLLGELCQRFGRDTVDAYMAHVQDNAAEKVAEAIARLPDGERRFSDRLDDGTLIAVRVAVQGDSMTIDFEGSADAHESNFNAPRAVTVAAVIYVLRLLVGESIPLASGCLRPVELRIPEPSLLAPPPDAAVAAGNVETSQRIVDVLLAALGKSAASQGTMNNLSFGAAGYAYYETIAGGAGATERGAGASAVHTHMTNTRITDPEVLESRFPVRLHEFSIRRDSGGLGARRGGDGVVRCFEALEAMTVTLLSDWRHNPPFGLDGGEPGRAGRNSINDQRVGGCATLELGPGDRVRIETPGGGGARRKLMSAASRALRGNRRLRAAYVVNIDEQP